MIEMSNEIVVLAVGGIVVQNGHRTRQHARIPLLAREPGQIRLRTKQIPLPVVIAEPVERFRPYALRLNEIGQGLIIRIDDFQVGEQISSKILECRIGTLPDLINQGLGGLLYGFVRSSLELASHLIEFTLKVHHGPQSIGVAIATRLHRWALGGRIEFEYFQVKIVDILRTPPPGVGHAIQLDERTAVDHANASGVRLIKNVLGP